MLLECTIPVDIYCSTAFHRFLIMSIRISISTWWNNPKYVLLVGKDECENVGFSSFCFTVFNTCTFRQTKLINKNYSLHVHFQLLEQMEQYYVSYRESNLPRLVEDFPFLDSILFIKQQVQQEYYRQPQMQQRNNPQFDLMKTWIKNWIWFSICGV